MEQRNLSRVLRALVFFSALSAVALSALCVLRFLRCLHLDPPTSFTTAANPNEFVGSRAEGFNKRKEHGAIAPCP
jgi:hypothetical protein